MNFLPISLHMSFILSLFLSRAFKFWKYLWFIFFYFNWVEYVNKPNKEEIIINWSTDGEFVLQCDLTACALLKSFCNQPMGERAPPCTVIQASFCLDVSGTDCSSHQIARKETQRGALTWDEDMFTTTDRAYLHQQESSPSISPLLLLQSMNLLFCDHRCLVFMMDLQRGMAVFIIQPKFAALEGTWKLLWPTAQ